jgi:uroporphyrin-3 C-methyltransferase
MNPEPDFRDTIQAPVPHSSPAAAVTPADPPFDYTAWRRLFVLALVLAVGGVVGSLMVWQKLSNVQQQLARQSSDSGEQAAQARLTAKRAEELAIETAAKLAVTEAKLSEVALQRTQLEDLMQSLSRSRDENLVVDIDSGIRLAQQQAQLTGSVEPLLAALKSADSRVARAAQPRLAQLQRAIGRDVARIKATALADTPALLIKLDELVAMVEDVPLANAVGGQPPGPSIATAEASKRQPDEKAVSWWLRMGLALRDEMRALVRVRTIGDPEAALLAPEQGFFVRENLKLRLLNARLGLLSRQVESSRADLATVAQTLGRYFDTSSRKTQTAVALLQQVQSQMRALEVPRIDDTLTALSTAVAGR